MSQSHASLVIRISAPTATCLMPGVAPKGVDESQLIREVRGALQPGAEIVLILGAYSAKTSILWLSDLGEDVSFQAGVRLLSVSARTDNDYLGPQLERNTAQSSERESAVSLSF